MAFGVSVMPGTVIAGYEIERALGRGGMGDVFVARKRGETRVVALKLLNPDLAADERFRTRFERESHMATSLEHPHIVPVYDYGEADGVRFIAMRYVDGPTLRDLVVAGSPLESRRCLALLDQVANALDSAHEIGLVHRDIKPANVLIARAGAGEFREHAYLTDFGISKYASSASDFTRTGQFVGTSLYAAPEQIKGEKVDGRTDVYSFGAMLFECLTGKPPYERETDVALMWAHIMDEPPRPSVARSDLPPALDDVIAKAMAKAMDDRFATCGEVVAAARTALAATSTTGGGPPAATPAPPTVVAAPATVIAPPVAEPVSVPEPEPKLEVEPEPEASTATEPEPSPETAIAPAARASETVAAEPATSAAQVDTGTVVAAGAPVDETRIAEPSVEIESPSTAAGATRIGAPPPAPVADGATIVAPRPADRPRASKRNPKVIAGAAAAGVVAVVAGAVLLLGGDDSPPETPPITTSTADAPAATTPPTVTGKPEVGTTLSASEGAWSGSPASFAYSWARCNGGNATSAPTRCNAIAGATGQRYTVSTRDVGHRLQVTVTAASDAGEGVARGSTAAVPAPPKPPHNTARPSVSGAAVQDGTLTTKPGVWDGDKPLEISRVWLRCRTEKLASCTPIAGAGATTYPLGSADVGQLIRVQETVRNAAGKTRAVSAPTGKVAPVVDDGGSSPSPPPPSPPSAPPPPPPDDFVPL